MSSLWLRRCLGAALGLGLIAVTGFIPSSPTGAPVRRPAPFAASAAGLALLGMAVPRKRGPRRAGPAFPIDEARYHTLFDHTPVQILEEDFTAVAEAFARLRAGGVTNLTAHLAAHPSLPREWLGLVRLKDANRPAIAAAGFADKPEMMARFPQFVFAPYLEVFDYQLERLWTGRRNFEEEFRYLDTHGQERACLMLCRAGERGGQLDLSRVVLVLLDITTARRTVEAQAESPEALRQILARANILIWWAQVRREGAHIRWKINVPSQSFDSPLYQLATAIDRGGLWDIEHAPDLPATSAWAERALLDGSPGYQQEFRVLSEKGATHWLSEDVIIRRLREDEWSLVGVITDVTERREAEEARRKTQAQLQQILGRTDCMLWQARVTEREGQFRWQLEAPPSGLQRRIFDSEAGIVREGITGDHTRSLYQGFTMPDHAAMDARSIAALRAGAPGYEQEFRLIKGSQTFWLHERVSITPVGPGQWDLTGISIDVTERHLAEEARRASEAQLQQILTRADCLLWQADVVCADGELQWCDFEIPPSGLYTRLFGETDPSKARWLWTPASAPDLPAMMARSRQAIRSGAPGYEQEFRVDLSGHTFWLHERVAIAARESDRWRLSGVIVDMTARHVAEEARKASEAQLREILERADCLLWRARVTFDGDEVRWPNFDMPASGLSARLFGTQAITAGGKLKLWSLLDVPELPEMNERNRQALLDGAPDYEQDFRVIRPEGTIWLHEHVSITPAGPNEWRLVGVLMDVTARREAELARKASEAQLQQILTRADCMLWQTRVTETDGQFIWEFEIPPSGLQKRIFGGDAGVVHKGVSVIKAKSLYGDFIVPELAEMDARSMAALRSGAPGYEQAFRLIKGDQTFWLNERVSITSVQSGQWDLVGITIDVTTQHEAEEARKESEEQLHQLLTRANCLLWQARVVENAAGVLDWQLFIPRSSLYRELFGADPEEHPTLMWSELNVPELAEMNTRATDAIRRGLPTYEQEFRARREDRWYWLHEQVSLTRLGPREWNLVGVITDISARRAAELALAAEKERLAVTLRAMTEGVITTDVQGVVQYVNRAAAELLGCEEAAAVGRPLGVVCHLREGRVTEVTAAPFARVLQEDCMVNLAAHTHLVSRDGTERQIEGCCIPIHAADSALIGAVLVFRDVTERERLEQEIARASKLESVGILAGGIAHDFNNILTVIIGNITLALLDGGELAKVEYYLRETERAALRARDLTQQLLTFAKGGEPIRAAVRLPEIIKEVAAFAMHGSRVKGEFDFPEDLWPADADKGQLSQVVQNLVINSIQAMPEGGIVRISGRNETPSDLSRPPFHPGDFVHIAVADTGTGIKAEHLAKVFDPYFTTKQQGSGLGLATVYSIVKRHQGHIEVESELGRGTTFDLWLPALREQQLELSGSQDVAAVPMHGRVLLMDDEETIREMARLLLNRLGLEVELAADGAEAVRMYETARAGGRPFDLVVMDLTVPGGMGGQEALAELRRINPDVKTIVSSGYSNDPVLANFRNYGFSGMVAKPYQLDDLTRALREALADDHGPDRPPAG
jgi:PAS domain S-box-containing protein